MLFLSLYKPLCLSQLIWREMSLTTFLSMNPRYKLVDLHLCVFPLKNQIAIILFINDGEIRYRRFYKQFRKLSEEEKVGVTNYLISLYCGDYFLCKRYNIKSWLNAVKKHCELNPCYMVWTANHRYKCLCRWVHFVKVELYSKLIIL